MIIYGFEAAYNLLYEEEPKYGGFANHPFYKRLFQLHIKNIKEVNYESEHPDGFNMEGDAAKNAEERINVVAVPEHTEECKRSEEADLMWKRQRCCDEIFAEYLNFVSRKVKKDYYSRVLAFIFLLRECVNECAERLNEDKKNLPSELFPPMKQANKLPHDDAGLQEYCLTSNAEQVPDVSNDFIMNYLPDNGIEFFSTNEAIDLTQNICHWLFINGYTCSKLSLIQ